MSRERLARISRSQHAVLRGADLRTTLTAREIRTEVRRGNLEKLHPDVYCVAGAPKSREQAVLAAVYAATPAVASHRSAAAMWGLLDRWPDMPEVSVRPPRRPRLRRVIVHRSLDLTDDRVTLVRNVPVTIPALTLLDLGAVCGPRTVERALERAIVSRITTVDDVQRLHQLLRRQGRSGAGPLDIVLKDLGLRSDDVDSRLEHAMGRLLNRYRLPPARFHHVVYDDHGVALAEPDFAYPDVKVIIEVDGYDAHGTPSALQLDLARQNMLVLRGWTILRFTWHDVTKRPGYVAQQIRQVLRALSVA